MLNINRAILVFYIFCCQGIKGDSRNSYNLKKTKTQKTFVFQKKKKKKKENTC